MSPGAREQRAGRRHAHRSRSEARHLDRRARRDERGQRAPADRDVGGRRHGQPRARPRSRALDRGRRATPTPRSRCGRRRTRRSARRGRPGEAQVAITIPDCAVAQLPTSGSPARSRSSQARCDLDRARGRVDRDRSGAVARGSGGSTAPMAPIVNGAYVPGVTQTTELGSDRRVDRGLDRGEGPSAPTL